MSFVVEIAAPTIACRFVWVQANSGYMDVHDLKMDQNTILQVRLSSDPQ